MKKTLFALVLVVSSLCGAFAQTASKAPALSAKSVIETAAKRSSVEDSIAYLKKNVSSVATNAEKRAVYAFLAAVLEQQGQYAEAQKTYAQAAGIQGSADAVGLGVPNKSSEQLVIDAVRCALCAGDYATAESYLNSAVRNSKDESVIAYVKLYEQWSVLCKATSEADTKEAVAMLKAYATLDSMKTVRPSVLLTLWHLTGEGQFAESLKKNFPSSMEAAVVKGEIQTLPTPFWYFVPRSGVDMPEIANAVPVASSDKAGASAKPAQVAAAEKSEKIVRQQLGLFREEANAKALVERLVQKGFKAEITSEKRPSGTTYYLVVVSENAQGTIGDELRTAGFECYPLFE